MSSGVDEISQSSAISARRGKRPGTRGAAIGHISPEACNGGPIAFVEEGDLVCIDIPSCKIEVRVDEAVLAARKAAGTCPEPRIKTGYLARYAKQVSSAARGAVLE